MVRLTLIAGSRNWRRNRQQVSGCSSQARQGFYRGLNFSCARRAIPSANPLHHRYADLEGRSLSSAVVGVKRA